MLDSWMGLRNDYGSAENDGSRVQRTSSGIAMVDQGNVSPRKVGPAGISRGLTLSTQDLLEGDIFPGRMTLGFVQIAVVGLVLFYIWTRNVQGGG